MADETPTNDAKTAVVPPTSDETVVLDPNRTVVLRPEDEAAMPPMTGDSSARHGAMDDYAICGKIGDGGMGVVYLARDKRLGRYVAIKRLNEKSLADPVLRQRFLQEARAVAALNHAYIVHIYALGEDALGPYIIMEYVSGPAQTEMLPAGQDAPPPKNLTLEEFVNKNGPMTADEAVSMILKIANTMVYAHSCGVIHRDLKPANILLDPTKEPKLVDFGLARIAPREGHTQVAELTVPGEKLISLGYSAPELEQDASGSDVRADIYSLGAILYFLLTGRNPRYYREQDVPAFLREVMRRSLETVREQRYRSAQDFVTALSEAASHGRTVAPTIKTTWRCKWCDAVNPISTKFCAECGWDGSERCRECNAEIFVGQQYCPSCGADCRMYEHVASIIKLMDQAWEDRHFERIATIAGRLHGFEPAGPTGRKMLSDAQARVEEAARKVARRNRLASLIPTELKAENYERAQAFIEEFRTLNEDAMVYEEELRAIPQNILARDLVRIRQCIRKGDWNTARMLTEGLAAKYGNVPEYQDVRARVQAHSRRATRILWGSSIAAAILLYLLSMPIAGKMAGGAFGPVTRVLYAPAHGLAHIPGIRWMMAWYTGLCDNGRHFDDYFPEAHADRMPSISERFGGDDTPENLPDLPDDLHVRQAAFEKRLQEIANRAEEQTSDLQSQYWRNINDFRDESQKAGDFKGVMAAQQAIEAYTQNDTSATELATDPPQLLAIKRRLARRLKEQRILIARQTRAAEQDYHKVLEEASKRHTMKNEMEQARVIQEEIDRISAIPAVTAAVELLRASRNDLFLGSEATVADSERLREELRTSREELRTKLRALNEKAEAELGDWPEHYGTALTNLLATFQQSGNFNAWEVVAREHNRFGEMKTLETVDIVEDPVDLRQMQETFIQRLRTVYATRDTAKAALYNDYLNTLEGRITTLTKEGKFAEAAVINQEIREIRQSRGYANATHTQPPQPAPQQTAPAPAPQAPAASAPVAPAAPVEAVPAQETAQPILDDADLVLMNKKTTVTPELAPTLSPPPEHPHD